MAEVLKPAHFPTVRAWVDGWVISRNAPRPVPEPWGLRVDVGLPGHVARHVVAAPTPDVLRRLTATITAPGTWLKLCAPAEAVAPLLPPPWTVKDREFMMTARLTRHAPPPEPPPGYALAVTTRAGVTAARLLTAAGEVAARGQFAVAGATAVVDQVETAPGHRRRGLGTVVMRTLAARAAARGARTGVLVATAEGQALYETLGWTLHTPMTAAVLTHP
ncbi:GNAT family N-acetyltransferase [Actinomadura sp. ATCC 31491]|uniref:GNAT family N-acetyltransferase n=1 Tax=Actinomadura luzonensis TaxID=2805427 RepID=A0ABT0FQ80_9ACTN|nr:GNAT family N-acetyltransferase [Actinomadura luzonensis]MCK2214497.1 GNAT family N-acetyltransferase [Actinomadura luzonensis]